jgi:hypothetical protein
MRWGLYYKWNKIILTCITIVFSLSKILMLL